MGTVKIKNAHAHLIEKGHMGWTCLELPLVPSFIRACRNDIRVVNLTISYLEMSKRRKENHIKVCL
ncbi:MAG: hypothetical protein DRN07_02840 [Thermoplasmata archaeon]|nr:MAG: hypothetical protein DRN07_02840 [Thermoplasmata archaeon]